MASMRRRGALLHRVDDARLYLDHARLLVRGAVAGKGRGGVGR